MKVLPKTVKRIAVLDRTKEPGALGEPLFLDIKTLFQGKENAPLVIGGRYGLSSKDTTPAQIVSVYENLELAEPKDGFTIGIVDDVTFKSLPAKANSTDSALTVQWERTRTPSRSSVTIHLNTVRDTLTMTQRNQADTHVHTSVSETRLSRLLTL